MSHLPAPDGTAVTTSNLWHEAVGYCNIKVANVTTNTTANFTQPQIGGTVTVSVSSSSAFTVGDTVAISGSLSTYRGGFYYVMSKPTTTSAVVLLIADGIAPGGTVVSGATFTSVTPIMITSKNRGQFVVTNLYADSLTCPGFGDTGRCTISIGWNKGGTPYSEFYSAQQLNFVATLSSATMASSLAATFVQPAINSSVLVTLATPAIYSAGTWCYPVGTTIRIWRAGVYTVSSLITTTTTANYTQPATSGSVVISVASTTAFAIGDYIWVSSGTTAGAGCYSITAKTATTLTCTLVTLSSSFLQGITNPTVIPSGATVTHASQMNVTLTRDPQASAGQTIATGNSVISYNPGASTTTASYVQPAIGSGVLVSVSDNTPFVVGTSVWLSSGYNTNAGLYSVASKTGLDKMTLTLSSIDTYAVGATVPSNMVINPYRQSGQVLPVRTFGTSRLSVDPGSPIGAYVSVAGNPTSAGITAIYVRGFYAS